MTGSCFSESRNSEQQGLQQLVFYRRRSQRVVERSGARQNRRIRFAAEFDQPQNAILHFHAGNGSVIGVEAHDIFARVRRRDGGVDRDEVSEDNAVVGQAGERVQQGLPPRLIVGRTWRREIGQFTPGSSDGLPEPLLPRPEIERRRGELGDRLEDFRGPLPEQLKRTCRFAAAAQWARIDRQAIERLSEGPSRSFGLLSTGGVETWIRVFAPAGRGPGVPDQIEFHEVRGCLHQAVEFPGVLAGDLVHDVGRQVAELLLDVLR